MVSVHVKQIFEVIASAPRKLEQGLSDPKGLGKNLANLANLTGFLAMLLALATQFGLLFMYIGWQLWYIL